MKKIKKEEEKILPAINEEAQEPILELKNYEPKTF